MKTALLTVGTEILFGQVVNTNAAYISKELQNLGYDVMYHYTVGDNPNRLRELLDFAFHDCELVLTTGGLGPTQDDLTKEIICEYFGDELVLFPEQLDILKEHFAKRSYRWTENNAKQAYFPSTARILKNPHGTAPGFALEKNGRMIMAMPGPPREMKEMFDNEVRPILESKKDSIIYYRILRAIDLGESRMETALLPLINGQTDPTIATYAKEGECSLRVTSKRRTRAEAEKACNEMIEKVNELIGSYIYSYDDEELKDVVCRMLIEKNISISCAESCTGGGFAKALTDYPGISSVFERGIVTYTPRAKSEELGIDPELIEKYHAESPEVAAAMAEGLRAKTGSDICISVTGIAGPDDLDADRPAGLAYIGLCYKGETSVFRAWRGNVSRSWNRQFFVLRMFNEIYKKIK